MVPLNYGYEYGQFSRPFCETSDPRSALQLYTLLLGEVKSKQMAVL